jgi:ribonuclease P protein component
VTRGHQKNFSAEQPEAQTAPRLPLAHGDEERPEDPGLASRQGPQAPERVSNSASSGAERPRLADSNSAPLALERLRLRREFLYVAGGYSERRRLLVVQGRRRAPVRETAGEGFTSTKKIGGSVIRNRARRRLREASRFLLPHLGVAGADYVFIARQETGTAPWPRLLDDMEKALISLRRRLSTGDSAPQPGSDPLSPARA